MTKSSVGCLVLLIAVASAPSHGADASLQIPAEVQAGSKLSVGWKGPGAQADFISIDTPGAPDTQYGPYVYPAQGNPVEIAVPSTAGDYVVRYHLAAGYTVIASVPLKVTDVSATLEPAPTVGVGGDLSINWTGPKQASDFISIDKPGTPDTSYGPYAYATQGSPAKIRAPDAPGNYVVRYHMAGGGYRVIGSAPVKVVDQSVTLSPPGHAAAGSRVLIKWSGPANQADFISIDPIGSDDAKYGAYAYPTATSDQVEIRAPEEAGDYLVRYHMGGSYRVLGSAPLRIDPVTANLTAPQDVAAGTAFEVGWQGPDNEGDFITVVKPDAVAMTYGASNGYTRRGNPVRLEAPREVGDYELRYLTGQGYGTLAKRALHVGPGSAVGKLRVVSDASEPVGAFDAVEFVLDASGSMLQRIGGERRIDVAKSALVGLTDVLPTDSAFALRVFGHKEADSCRTDLEIKQPRVDKAAAVAAIKAITAKNLAKTPIGASLLKVKEDLAGTNGSVLVILMTDGEETCDGDPKAAIDALRADGADVRVSIVGFAVDEVGLKETFAQWAQAGNGAFFDAQNAEQLKRAVRATLSPTFEVVRAGKAVASGTVNGGTIELPVGDYLVRLHGAPPKDLGQATIQADATAELHY
jgi:hypothetical protein